MQCPNCSRNIDESLFPASPAFCPYCGQDLKPASQETERLAFCPYCGRELLAETNFCPHCGKQLKVSGKRLSRQKVGKAFLERAVKPLARLARDTFSSEKRARKLFQQWSEYAELPPDEVPSIESLREMHGVGQAKHSPIWYLVVAIAALIVVALIILLVIQC